MQTQYEVHQAAIEAAFAYLRAKGAINKLAEPCPVWGRHGACFWLPAGQSCLAPKPKRDVQLVATPTVRFRKVWPPSYQPLPVGALIQEGDEVEIWPSRWYPYSASAIGTLVQARHNSRRPVGTTCQEPLDNSLLARLAGWFRRNLI